MSFCFLKWKFGAQWWRTALNKEVSKDHQITVAVSIVLMKILSNEAILWKYIMVHLCTKPVETKTTTTHLHIKSLLSFRGTFKFKFDFPAGTQVLNKKRRFFFRIYRRKRRLNLGATCQNGANLGRRFYFGMSILIYKRLGVKYRNEKLKLVIYLSWSIFKLLALPCCEKSCPFVIT